MWCIWCCGGRASGLNAQVIRDKVANEYNRC